MQQLGAPHKTLMDFFSVIMWALLFISCGTYLPFMLYEEWHKHKLMTKVYLIIYVAMVMIMCLGAMFFSVSNVK